MSDFLPYAKHQMYDPDEMAVRQVLWSGRLTQGPEVEAFESEFAAYCGAKYAVAVSSGTAALHLAYLACGAGPGTTVLTSPVTFVATANAALYCGADVAFADVDKDTGLMAPDVDWGEAEYVVGVTLGGQQYDNPDVDILDACHGPYHLAKWHKAACFSFHPCKHIAAGEGGAVVTNDPGVYVRCVAGRDHGNPAIPEPTGRHMCSLGYNYRMPELSAALARSQLNRLDWNIERRREIAAQYDEAFNGRIRTVPHSDNSARHLFQLLVEKRDTKRDELAKLGVGSQVHYHPILPLQPYYRERFGYGPGVYPNAEWFSDHALTIPLYPTLTEAEIETVIKAVLEVCG